MSKGIVKFTANGRPYDAKADCVLDLGIPRSEEILNGKGDVVDYKTVYSAPKLTVSIVKSENLNITNDLLKMVDATIVVIDGDGTKFMINNARHKGAGEYNFEDGVISAEFGGSSATEI
jgi:hypothetical protein